MGAVSVPPRAKGEAVQANVMLAAVGWPQVSESPLPEPKGSAEGQGVADQKAPGTRVVLGVGEGDRVH